ncbi:MAG: DUF1573 domain-containing protein [Gemmataceae bacterium]
MKLYGLSLDPFAEGSVLASPRLQIAAIELEILLGLWLLAGWAARWSWLASLGMFSVFACVSLYLALAGQASCSCFGRLMVSPWITVGIDVAAVAALVVWRPVPDVEGLRPAWVQQVVKVAVGVCLLLAIGSGAARVGFASPAEALAWLRGEAVTVDPAVYDVGKGTRGEERTFRIQLTNRTRQPIQVVGGTTTCSCVTTKDLPLTLAEGETESIEVSVAFVGSPGRFQRLFRLITDAASQPRVVARFSGEVLPSAE